MSLIRRKHFFTGPVRIVKKASDKSILWLNRIAVSCIAIIIVSLCTKNPEGIEEQFDTVKDYEL
ncbi:MAG: hypothetical protein IJZ42_05815 [Lachnospiraceae bacterium]|nr:hypothetical protein [Lachnospiraceae bacterium]